MNTDPSRRHYVSIFVISLSLLVLEIALSRVLSVVMVSHYAFVAISLAMFGLGLSGLVVYLFPGYFLRERLDRQLIDFSGWFGVTAALSVFLFLQFRVVQELSLEGFLTLSLAYALLAIPFFLGGICISLLMTHFSARMGRIYAADLIGASLGCLGVVLAMEMLPATLISLVVSSVISGGALVAAARGPRRTLLAPVVGCVTCAALLGMAATTNLYEIRYIKQWTSPYNVEYEAWNSFSRVGAFPAPTNAAQNLPLANPVASYAGDQYPKTMILDIDGAAWTPMMNFDGNLESIQFLRGSILYAVHRLRPDARVLLIGLGGGRDILAARAFGQRSVKGIEINPLMYHVVEERYGDYSGHPYTTDAEVIIDEARSHLHRLDEEFDIIQLSMIDTLSLNAAGGMVFSENNLYTVEGFQQYFQHLSDDGFLNLTRYFVPAYPMEMQRLVALGREAWAKEGIGRFQDHIAVLSSLATGTVVIKKSPYTVEDLERLDRLARESNIRILYRPGAASGANKAIAEVITTENYEQLIADHPFLIHAPTDDKPFFWNLLRGRVDELPSRHRDPFGFVRMWDEALALMHLLIFVVTTFAVVFFVGPLLFVSRRGLRGAAVGQTLTFLLYFGCLGYGFLLIEIPMLQSFILLLGQPVYALSVVLFSLLLFSGLGSLWSSRFLDRATRTLAYALLGIIVLSAMYVLLLSQIITALLGMSLFVRLAATVGLLAPMGLLLGMAYPLGINILREFNEGLVPWAWGVNGVMSVVASVLASYVASKIGFTGALLTGVVAYVLAGVCLAIVTRARQAAAT